MRYVIRAISIFATEKLKTEPAEVLELAIPGSGLWQERKRKFIDTDDYTIMITTVKRCQTLFPSGTWQTGQPRTQFLANVVCKWKKKKTVLTLSTEQRQTLFDRFTNILPRVIVSEILHCDSDVFLVARYGTVEDLTRLIVAGEAGLHVRDTRGWSLLHVSTKPT